MDKALRESDYLIAWLAFFAAVTVLGGIVGGVFGGVAGVVLGASGVARESILTLVRGWAYVVAIPVSYGCFRLAVRALIVRKTASRLAAQGDPAGTPSTPILAEENSAALLEPGAETPVASRQSGLGAVSLACAVVAAATYAAALVYLVATDFGDTEMLYGGIVFVMASGLGFFAFGLGIGGLFQQGRKRALAIVGSISSSMIVAVLALTWAAIGLAVLAGE